MKGALPWVVAALSFLAAAVLAATMVVVVLGQGGRAPPRPFGDDLSPEETKRQLDEIRTKRLEVERRMRE